MLPSSLELEDHQPTDPDVPQRWAFGAPLSPAGLAQGRGRRGARAEPPSWGPYAPASTHASPRRHLRPPSASTPTLPHRPSAPPPMQERKSRLLGHPERRLAAFIPPRPATPSPRPRRGTAASESAVLGGPRCPLRGLCGSSGHSFLGGSVLLDPAASPQLGDRHHPAPSAEGRGRMQTTWSSKFLIGERLGRERETRGEQGGLKGL